ncbi:MAG: reverse transcriptase family protein, partial [Gammaproteobacteria bacterium]|nr:reverse transcriptase family protein [Gammaproteobacteria bacterium]
NLICSKQHGFRSGRSCLTQLLHHLDDVLESLTNNCDSDSIYLDYAKAFDKVDHKLLIKKLHRYAINPKIIKWIESFLSDRKQAVVVDGHVSFLALIISGVPQGTVLGPILFLIFINDIEHCITKSIIRCFADDTRVSKSVSCEHDVSLLQNDLYSVIQWSERNNMVLHMDKFEYMCHRHNRRSTLVELPFVSELYQYSVSHDKSLTPVGQLRDLGVLISSDLSWTPHIKAIANKARQKAAWVFSVFRTRSSVIMLTLYKSMVRSLLEYCCPLSPPREELASYKHFAVSAVTSLPKHDSDGFVYQRRMKTVK